MGHLLPTLPVPSGVLASFFAPAKGASPNAQQIHTLYVVTLVIALIIFFAVEIALGYALIRFRKRKGAVPDQVHGHTGLEVGWTAAAAVILLGLAILTFVKLSSIENPPNSGAGGLSSGSLADLGEQNNLIYASNQRKLPPNGKVLEINVIGRQYIWQYIYPGANEPDGLGAPYSYEEMVVPTKTTVELNIVSEDVVHSWWIPELGGKFQAVPGYHNYTWFKVEKPGVFRGQCAFLCGRGHARMIATVRAEEPPQFEEWLAHQKQQIAEANEEAAKARKKLNAEAGPGAVENP